MLSFPCQYPFNRPALIETRIKGFLGYTKALGPLSYCKILPIKSEAAIVALVIGLLCRRGPSAVIRFIIAIEVYAIKRIPRPRAWPHVIVKGLKRFTPARANLDPPSAVTGKRIARGIGTPLNHVYPNAVFRPFDHAVLSPRLILAQTATAAGMTLTKRLRYDSLCVSARTLTEPAGFLFGAVGVVSESQHGQAAERLAGQVLLDCLRNGYNLLSHVRTPYTNVMRGLRGVRSALQSPLFYHIPEKQQLGTLAPDGTIVGQGLEGF